MKVLARAVGYYGTQLRQVGDVFDIADDVNEAGEVIAFSKRWMRKVETDNKRED